VVDSTDTFLSPSRGLGVVVVGSLSTGLEVRLHPDVGVEGIRVGKFVIIQGKTTQFFSMLTDVVLGTASPRILMNPPKPEEDFLSEILMGTGTFGTIKVTPMLMLEGGNATELRPVKTVPSHFSQVYESSSADFAKVFGLESDPTRKNFYIGQPLDMDVPVCLDLERFVERSNGIFGKSGTGKSFLTRLILCGTIRKEAAVNLIFDMHSEYGWEAAKEGKDVSTVKGLQQLFPGQVKIFSLDPASSERRGVRAQGMFISYDQIEIEDLALVRNELNISEASLENAIILRNHFGPSWISRLGGMSSGEIQEFCQENMGNAPSIMALQRKLLRLEDLKYMKQVCPHDYIGELLQTLAAGRHVVIEFGSQGSLLGYMLATNIITRRLHGVYVKKSEKYLQTKNPLDKPRQLMITIEEAHRFLDPRVARSTIFGTIAREMRKYFVTLLVVDQRPSGIDNEIMSQLGTRITAALNDDKDIEAVFTGMSGGQALRTVLAQMDPKQQALVLGYAVPMPVVVRTRAYDSQLYREIGAELWETRPTNEVLQEAELARSDLGF